MSWERALRACTDPLPGSVPYENRRPVSVPLKFDGFEIGEFLAQRCPFLGEDGWRRVIESGRVIRRNLPLSPCDRVTAGDVIVHVCPDTVEPDVDVNILVIFEDDHVLVIDKPAPLPVHPSGRYNKNTLTSLLELARPDVSLRLVHRLDTETTGCILLAKSRAAGNALREQFENRRVEKEYIARVHPGPEADYFECDLGVSREPHEAGTRRVDGEGLDALTCFDIQKRFADGGALLRVRPRSGRTHQIRLHLKSVGSPVVGDGLYREGSQDEALCLHAHRLSFRHPVSGESLLIEAELPSWADQ